MARSVERAQWWAWSGWGRSPPRWTTTKKEEMVGKEGEELGEKKRRRAREEEGSRGREGKQGTRGEAGKKRSARRTESHNGRAKVSRRAGKVRRVKQISWLKFRSCCCYSASFTWYSFLLLLLLLWGPSFTFHYLYHQTGHCRCRMHMVCVCALSECWSIHFSLLCCRVLNSYFSVNFVIYYYYFIGLVFFLRCTQYGVEQRNPFPLLGIWCFSHVFRSIYFRTPSIFFLLFLVLFHIERCIFLVRATSANPKKEEKKLNV